MNYKPAISFSELPTLKLVQKILQASSNSSTYGNDARKWFEMAKKISFEKGEKFDELEEWLGLVSLFFPLVLCTPGLALDIAIRIVMLTLACCASTARWQVY